MCEVPVLYATTHGQTRRIAEAIAAALRDRGLSSTAIDVAAPEAEQIVWARARAVVLGASLHAGAHQSAAASFVRRHLSELNARPALFVSVSLSTCSALTSEVEAAWTLARAFPEQNGWRPWRVGCVGGRLAYPQYNLLIRFVMRRIARKAGGPTDTSRDHELTDWDQVRQLAGALADEIQAGRPELASRAAAGGTAAEGP